MLKKFFIILLSIMLMIGTYGSVNATELKTSLDIIQKASETKYLENNQGCISKTIVDSNSDTGEVTVELKLSNNAKEVEDTTIYENTEIYIMIPESIVIDEEKFAKRIQDIENLSSKILNYSSKTKIGIIGIMGTIADSEVKDGKLISGENNQSNVEGSSNNAEIVVNLTNNLNEIKTRTSKYEFI